MTAVRPFLALASLLVVLPATALAQSVPAQDLRLAYQAWPDLNPACVGHVNVTFGQLPNDVFEVAAGLDTTTWTLRSCDILFDREQWVATDREERCVTLVHAVGHLALHHHEEGGVMTANGAHGTSRYQPCELAYTTPRQRIQAVLEHHGWVTCGRWHRRVLPCAVTRGKRTTRYHAWLARGAIRIAPRSELLTAKHR